jgi:hypothetical protein
MVGLDAASFVDATACYDTHIFNGHAYIELFGQSLLPLGMHICTDAIHAAKLHTSLYVSVVSS